MSEYIYENDCRRTSTIITFRNANYLLYRLALSFIDRTFALVLGLVMDIYTDGSELLGKVFFFFCLVKGFSLKFILIVKLQLGS